jgi:GntR family transcriptional regulator/MocR family aminotransferase
MTPRPLPVHRQIYERMRQSVADGRLSPGDRIAPTRVMAAQLGVARGTVDLAYTQLAAEGYIVAEGARGTFISSDLPKPLASHTGPNRDRDERSHASLRHDWKAPYRVGVPAFDLFPRKLWSNLATRHARSVKPGDLGYPSPLGDTRLRKALANYLLVSRGIQCTADQVFITGGHQSAVSLIGRVLLSAGDKVWVENPGYIRTGEALAPLGVIQVPVAVDSSGMRVEHAMATNPDATLCVVSPANQFPLGVALLALLDWAARRGGWIVEDDYDGEFYYNGRPLPALKSLDCADRVFYLGTFSKTLFPALRLGYAVVPDAMVHRLRSACIDLDGGRSTFDQAIVADFIESGYFARHLKRMRSLYKARRAAAVVALNAELGHAMHFDLGAYGLHAVGWMNNGGDDKALLTRATAAGYRLMAMSDLGRAAGAAPGLVVGLTNIPEAAAAKLAQELRFSLAL